MGHGRLRGRGVLVLEHKTAVARVNGQPTTTQRGQVFLAARVGKSASRSVSRGNEAWKGTSGASYQYEMHLHLQLQLQQSVVVPTPATPCLFRPASVYLGR